MPSDDRSWHRAGLFGTAATATAYCGTADPQLKAYRLADRFERQNTVWNLAMMKSLAVLLPRLQRRSDR